MLLNLLVPALGSPFLFSLSLFFFPLYYTSLKNVRHTKDRMFEYKIVSFFLLIDTFLIERSHKSK